MYEIIAEISTPGCPPFFEFAPITATAMNDNGVVVGSFIGCNLDHPLPFMWSEETGFIAIPLPPGVPTATPMDVNNHNEIVGVMDPTGPGGDRAFHWKDGVWTELPLLPGFPQAHAFAINDSSETVGEAFDPFSFEPFRAVQWHNGEISELQLPIGPESSAADINNSSQITGWMGSDVLGRRAFLLTKGRTINIGTAPNGLNAVARRLNSAGVVAGEGQVMLESGNTVVRSFIATNANDIADLSVLPGNAFTRVLGINDATQVVGYCHNQGLTNLTPFFWQHGEIRDLRLLIDEPTDDLFLREANAINHFGQIVVHGSFHLFVLTPIDRPLGDVNLDCAVDERDLIAVLADWGEKDEGEVALTDIVTSATFQPPGDGCVDAADLAVVLGNWSPQPNDEPPAQGNTRR